MKILRATNTCMSCTNSHALLHWITFCAEAKGIWKWTGARLVLTHRTDPHHVPSQWLLFPRLYLWLRRKHNASIRIFGSYGILGIPNHKSLSDTDCIDFLRQSRWKTYQWSRRQNNYGNYLVTWYISVMVAVRGWTIRNSGKSNLLSLWYIAVSMRGVAFWEYSPHISYKCSCVYVKLFLCTFRLSSNMCMVMICCNKWSLKSNSTQ